MSSMEVAANTLEMFKKCFTAGKRIDGRGLEQYRDITLEYDISKAAEGSVRVRLGKTEVLVGIKLTLDKPYPDSLDKGNLMVSGDLLPLASPRFEAGPPKFDAIELPRLVDRAIRESHVIAFDKLVVKPGEKVWTVIIDVYPINDDGNLVDASIIGAIAALRTAVLPGIDEAGNVDYKHRTKQKLPLTDAIPLGITAYKLGSVIFFDPVREEEEAAEVKINFGITKAGKKYAMHSCQKTGATPLTKKELEYLSTLIPKKYDELREKLKKFL